MENSKEQPRDADRDLLVRALVRMCMGMAHFPCPNLAALTALRVELSSALDRYRATLLPKPRTYHGADGSTFTLRANAAGDYPSIMYLRATGTWTFLPDSARAIPSTALSAILHYRDQHGKAFIPRIGAVLDYPPNFDAVQPPAANGEPLKPGDFLADSAADKSKRTVYGVFKDGPLEGRALEMLVERYLDRLTESDLIDFGDKPRARGFQPHVIWNAPGGIECEDDDWPDYPYVSGGPVKPTIGVSWGVGDTGPEAVLPHAVTVARIGGTYRLTHNRRLFPHEMVVAYRTSDGRWFMAREADALKVLSGVPLTKHDRRGWRP